MEPLKIDTFLAKYKKYKEPNKDVVRQAAQISKELLKYPITDRNFSYSSHSRTLFIHSAGPQKAELLMRRDVILKKLTEALGANSSPNHIR